MSQRKRVSIGERWRLEAHRAAGDQMLEKALSLIPLIRKPSLRIRAGAIQTEMEGAMGAINEVSVHVPVIQPKLWPQVARVLRRSASMLSALESGRVPRSFDRLVDRIAGESIFPPTRKISTGCTCGAPERPCRHVVALLELFARRLDERPWEMLTLRGVNLHDLLALAKNPGQDELLPALASCCTEEPSLFPEAEHGDLDFTLTPLQAARLAGAVGSQDLSAFHTALNAWAGVVSK